MDSDRQMIYDALQEKAREHADMALFDIMEKYKSAPWNEFRDALADIFLAGATEALAAGSTSEAVNTDT